MSKKQSNPTQPYGSFRDLPSYQEMAEFARGAKFLTLFIARSQRRTVKEIQKQMEEMADVVDGFYELLGPRNWVFHDQLDLARVRGVMREAHSAEEAEERFIGLYGEEEQLRRWILRLSAFAEFRCRLHLIERARSHYEVRQFDSCTLLLVTVMDGFVNDFQPDRRKGLAARDPDEMAAWDSVVGHHMGLTHVMPTFTKTIKKRVDDEVFELHRHGVVHGSVVKYDNIVVATKAWNMLFAVADWATATLKSQKTEEPTPGWNELLIRVRANRDVKEQLAAWQASSYSVGDSGLEELEVYKETDSFFAAWRAQNYGAIADLENRIQAKGRRRSEVAGEMRELFGAFELTSFNITEVRHVAPVISVVTGTATVNGHRGAFECRWTRQNEDGGAAIVGESGEWKLVFCSPSVWTEE